MKENIHQKIRSMLNGSRTGRMSRRDLLKSFIAVPGSYAAAQLLLESSGFAQATDSGETVRFASGQAQIEAYLAKPKEAGKRPAVIVIHENRGLTDHFRDVARRFAAEGFIALAPDFVSRMGGTAKMKSPQEAAFAIGSRPPLESVGDVKAAFDFIAKHADVDPQKIASVGFGWGGWRSFMLATREPKLHRAVLFYGNGPDTGFANIQAEVMAHYAKWDNRITGNALWLDEQMKKAGKKFQYYVYEADHGFFDEKARSYNADAAKEAWRRTISFLRG